MKLKKFIKMIDPASHVKIYIGEDEEPDFDGYIFDIPHRLMKYKLDTSGIEEWYPVDIGAVKNEYNVAVPFLVICLKEE